MQMLASSMPLDAAIEMLRREDYHKPNGRRGPALTASAQPTLQAQSGIHCSRYERRAGLGVRASGGQRLEGVALGVAAVRRSGMSIARTAPESFELQDLVCVELTLRFGLDRIDRMLVEPKGGEDGSLFTTGPHTLHYEVQVKGVVGTISLTDFALWLTHFPERKAQNMLLERLIADADRRLILVVSGRASDALASLVAPRGWAGADLGAPPTALAADLLVAFRNSAIDGNAKRKLLADRIAHHTKVASTMTEAQIAAVLRRTVIVEGATLRQVRYDVGLYLAALGIPSDVHADVTGRLRANVGLKRKDGGDVALAIASQIERDAPTTVMPLDYVEGTEESAWIEHTRTANCLLLSGVTRSGKSVAARFVAASFERDGARVEEVGTVEAAERFLLGGAQGARVAVLDDPLGGAHAAVDPDRQLYRLAALLPRLDTRRRLIVAQGRERLLEVAGVKSIEDAAVAGHAWVDTAARPANFRARLWLTFADQSGVREPLRSAMAQAVEECSVKLEAGSLEFLANLPDALPGVWSVAEAERAALVDAAALSRALAGEVKSALLPALAIASAPRAPIADEELAFVTSFECTSLPSKADYLGLAYSFGGGDRAPAPLPAYEGPITLATEIRDDLDALEKRRMIVTGSVHGTGFTHPFYRAAAEIQFRHPTRRTADAMLAMHERALFSRVPRTSKAAARNLDWLLDYAGGLEGVADALFQRAEAGLKSLFPTTRDLCFEFIIRHFDRAEAALTEPIAKVAWHVASIELESLEWLRGEAILPVDGHVRNDAISRGWFLPNASTIAPALSALAIDGAALTPEAAADTLLYLKNRPSAAQPSHVTSLLSYEEGVLRADAARMWLARKRSGDEAILARIFADSHPLVARRALGGVIASYNLCGIRRRARLLDGLAAMAVAPANAAFFLERLVLFDRDPPEADERPWQIFARLMPLVFEHLPIDASFIEARLHSAMDEAGGHLSAEEFAVVCDRWVGWIERMDAADHWLNDFALGVLELLFRYCAKRPNVRGDMVARLLSLRITGSLLTVIKDAVDVWEDLSREERQALLECLTTDEADARWRRAVALTRSNVPAEIEEALLPAGVKLADGAASVRQAIQPELFAACMGIVCSYPTMLGEWRASAQAAIWNEAIAEIARRPADSLFDAAFSCLVARSARTDTGFVDCLTTAAKIDADAVFEHLLERSIYDGAMAHAEQWQTLLTIGPSDGNRDRWFDRMAKVAHEVVDSAIELDKWMRDSADRKQIEARLSADFLVYRALFLLAKVQEAIEQLAPPLDDAGVVSDPNDVPAPDMFAEAVMWSIETRPPSFLKTVDDARDVLKRENLLTNKRAACLAAAREILVSTHDDARRAYSYLDRVRRPTDWIAPA